MLGALRKRGAVGDGTHPVQTMGFSSRHGMLALGDRSTHASDPPGDLCSPSSQVLPQETLLSDPAPLPPSPTEHQPHLSALESLLHPGSTHIIGGESTPRPPKYTPPSLWETRRPPLGEGRWEGAGTKGPERNLVR